MVTEVANVTLVLHLAPVPLVMRNVQMLIIEAPMSKLLLGEPDLVKLGFDAKHHVGAVREEFTDSDFSTANQRQTTSPPDVIPPVMGSLSARLCLLDANKPSESADLPGLASSTDSSTSEALNINDVPDVPEENTAWSTQLAQLEGAPAQNADTDTPLLRYGHVMDDDPLADYHYVEVGEDDAKELDLGIEEMLSQRQVTHMISDAGQARLSKMVSDYKDILASKLGSHPPAKVPPLTITLKPGACPVRVPTRTYSLPQRFYGKQTRRVRATWVA